MYLMFDHNGVLDGAYVGNRKNIEANDLILQAYEFGGYQVLKNGVSIVAAINELVTEHGAQVVFHSKNIEETQIELLRQLEKACAQKNISFPTIHGMAVYDPARYSTSASSDPALLDSNEIPFAGWGMDDLDGKASVRRALEVLLAIDEADRGNHVVFDDGPPNVSVPRKEGYQAYLIGNGVEAETVTLDQALQLVLAKARAARHPDIKTQETELQQRLRELNERARDLDLSDSLSISEAATVLMACLNNSELSLFDKKGAIQTFEDTCNDVIGESVPMSLREKVLKAVAAVAVAALVTVLAAAIGFGIGFAAGLWTGPGAFISGVLAGGAAAVTVAAASASLGVGGGVISAHGLFKPKKETLLQDSVQAVVSAVKDKLYPPLVFG